MASLHRTGTEPYHVFFRYQGRQYHRSLGTRDAKKARRQQVVIDLTLEHLENGVLSLGERFTTEQLWLFVKSGGKVASNPKVIDSVTLGLACKKYEKSFGASGKELSTLGTEKVHVNHCKRILGEHALIDTLAPADVRDYIATRESEEGSRGRNVQPETIRKELQTLRQVWEFAKTEGWVIGDNPVSQVKKPRSSERMPFMSWDEIERRIQRGGLTEAEISDVWECLFLRETEIGDFLGHVKEASQETTRFRYMYAVIAFCAYTGARRSEMFRCLVDDLSVGRVVLREKKKSQERRITFRQIPLHAELETIINEWLDVHPGGQFLFCKQNGNSLDGKTAQQAFAAMTNTSKWQILRGYHVFRHSFASNLARHGVDQYKIDELMGHQTEEQRRRYRHLFPEDRESAVEALSFNRPKGMQISTG